MAQHHRPGRSAHSLTHGRYRDPRGSRDDSDNRDGAIYFEEFFAYPVTFGDASTAEIAPGATYTTMLQITDDADFKIQKMTAYGTLNGGDAPFLDDQITECTLQVQDTGSGRYMTQGPVPLSSIAGTGRLPFILPAARIFRARATIRFVVNNQSADNTYLNVTLSLLGTKMFRDRPPR